MKRRVYIETTVISYLASRPSRDVIVAGRQQLTQAWWETRRSAFEIVISQVVLDEAGAGDPEAAHRRLALIEGLPLLDMTSAVETLAATLIEEVPLPAHAAADAAHIAVAAWHGVEFVLTWNVAHIANAVLRRRVEAVCRRHGHAAPILCTPDELMEDPDV
ncbi:MAG: type II toxin-antitoxin system VapC family toxin [Acidobacteria bacterium]|nr:type II toxin-antitoxin system VapC family toxin [Acidobacteriota bacterium]